MNNRLSPILLILAMALSSTALASDDNFGWKHHHDNMHNNMPGFQSGPHSMPPITSNHRGPMGTHPGEHGNYNNYREYRPRNAARNFLHMDKMLNLSSEQKAELRKLRDDWIENQSVPQAQLKVARSDLIHMIYSDTDSSTIDEHLKKIGQLEGGLWRAFVAQYKSIIKLLTDKQKKMVLDDSYFK